MSTIDLVTFNFEGINTQDLWKTEDADEEENQVTNKLFLRYKILPYLELYDIRLCSTDFWFTAVYLIKAGTLLYCPTQGVILADVFSKQKQVIYFVSSAGKTLVRFFMKRAKNQKYWNKVGIMLDSLEILLKF